MTSGRRPAPPPPRGRVTLARAAELSGLSPGQVYRRVVTLEEVPSRWDNGVRTIPSADVAKLKPREAKVDDRPGVTFRVAHERWAAWSRSAGDLGVAEWLRTLADRESGWEG